MFIYSIFIEILYVIANAVIYAVRFVFAKVKEATSKIPKAVIDEIARALLPNILDYFASDRGKKEFEEWKKKNIVKKKQHIQKESHDLHISR